MYRRERMPTVMLAVILVMSGFNSIALVIVADPGAQPEDITVTVDFTELLAELQSMYVDEEYTEIPEEVQPVLEVYQPQKGEYGLSPFHYPPLKIVSKVLKKLRPLAINRAKFRKCKVCTYS